MGVPSRSARSSCEPTALKEKPMNTTGKIIFSIIAVIFCFGVADTAGAVGGSIVFVWLIWWGFEMGAD